MRRHERMDFFEDARFLIERRKRDLCRYEAHSAKCLFRTTQHYEFSALDVDLKQVNSDILALSVEQNIERGCFALDSLSYTEIHGIRSLVVLLFVVCCKSVIQITSAALLAITKGARLQALGNSFELVSTDTELIRV